MAQILVHLPEDLVRRFRASVPPRQRSRFVQDLLEQALPNDRDDALYRTALAVEADTALNDEMAEWDAATSADGLGDRS